MQKPNAPLIALWPHYASSLQCYWQHGATVSEKPKAVRLQKDGLFLVAMLSLVVVVSVLEGLGRISLNGGPLVGVGIPFLILPLVFALCRPGAADHQWHADLSTRHWVAVDLSLGTYVEAADLTRDGEQDGPAVKTLAPDFEGALAFASTGASYYIFFADRVFVTDSLASTVFDRLEPPRDMSGNRRKFVAAKGRVHAECMCVNLDARLRGARAYLPLRFGQFLVVFGQHCLEVDDLKSPSKLTSLQLPAELMGPGSLSSDPLGTACVVSILHEGSLRRFRVEVAKKANTLRVSKELSQITLGGSLAPFVQKASGPRMAVSRLAGRKKSGGWKALM